MVKIAGKAGGRRNVVGEQGTALVAGKKGKTTSDQDLSVLDCEKEEDHAKLTSKTRIAAAAA